MPELPEVEYYKDYFNRTAVGKEIVKISCGDEALLEDINCTFLGRALHGKSFSGAKRRGKFLIAAVAEDSYLLIFHFGMTGYLVYKKSSNFDEEAQAHTHLMIRFASGYELRWVNQRKLGGVYFVREPEQIPLINEMGPEPLELSNEDFRALLGAHEQKNIKSFLMAQRDIAGIGSEYADEVLYRAGIDPQLKISSISPRRRDRLYTVMKETLTAAIAQRPPKNGLSQDWLKQHHEDMQCPKNKQHKLKKQEVSGRTTYWCPKHQE